MVVYISRLARMISENNTYNQTQRKLEKSIQRKRENIIIVSLCSTFDFDGPKRYVRSLKKQT